VPSGSTIRLIGRSIAAPIWRVFSRVVVYWDFVIHWCHLGFALFAWVIRACSPSINSGNSVKRPP
jgi:hypothetical protein